MLAAASPRLARILEIMLRKDAPISAGEIATSLGSSRRTLFRELKNAAPMLAAYNVSIASVPGKGLGLRSFGTDSASTRKKLADALREKSASRLPSSRKERRLGLIVKLLGDSNVHKLCYFANALGISEATVSNDLDELEPWLNKRFITLVRRPGLGVCVDAEEAAIRRALLRRLVLDGLMGRLPYLKTLGYPPPDITDGMDELFTNRFDRAFNWMTEDSSDMLRLFLIVGIERIAKGFLLAEDGAQPESGGYLRQLSNFIADNLEARFSVSLPPPERAAIARQLKTCRAMLHNPFDPAKTRDYSDIQSLVHEMIERFDPELAPSLKMNENLLTGLSLHLWAALDRLEKQMELPDTMHNEVAEKFPELFEKSLRALTVLEERLGVPVPQSEAALIALHFYAVLFNLEARNTRKRMLRVCIVCVGGIGVSYMLASQVRRHYSGELEIDLRDRANAASFDAYDFLISLMPLEEANKPVIIVNSFLSDEDHRHIRQAIDKYAFVKRTAAGAETLLRSTFAERVKQARHLLDQVDALLTGFRRVDVNGNCGFEELVAVAASSSCTNEEQVTKALIEREAVSSQVLPRLSLVLLHARTSGTARPVLALLVPDGGAFRDKYFRGAKSCVLMLLPADSTNEISEIMGLVSGALVDGGGLIDAVHAGDAERARSMLEAEISEYIVQFCKEHLKY